MRNSYEFIQSQGAQHPWRNLYRQVTDLQNASVVLLNRKLCVFGIHELHRTYAILSVNQKNPRDASMHNNVFFNCAWRRLGSDLQADWNHFHDIVTAFLPNLKTNIQIHTPAAAHSNSSECLVSSNLLQQDQHAFRK